MGSSETLGILLFASTIGRVSNVIKKLERERLGIRGSRVTKEQLAEEMADAVICLDLAAMHEGIDLNAAVIKKFNATSDAMGLKTHLLRDGAWSYILPRLLSGIRSIT